MVSQPPMKLLPVFIYGKQVVLKLYFNVQSSNSSSPVAGAHAAAPAGARHYQIPLRRVRELNAWPPTAPTAKPRAVLFRR